MRCRPDWPALPSIWGAVTEPERSHFIRLQALDRAHREWPWLGAMFLHHWQPRHKPAILSGASRTLQPDGERISVCLCWRYKTYPLPESAQNGFYHALNEHARYSGVWQFSELGADIGWLHQSDSQLEFDFYGSDLAMLLREDDYVAFLYPTVDGQPANAVQTDSQGKAYIFLRSNSREPETNLVPVAAEPSARAAHASHAVADRGWDRWAIAGYAVSSGDLSLPYNQQITLGAVVTLLVAAGLRSYQP